MNRAHYLKTDIRRLIKNYPIYLAIVGVAVSMWFSLEDYAFTEGMVNGNALDTYGFAVSMSGIMIAYAFCAFSYATVFCEDLEYKYARYSINRGNTWKYVVSKAVVVYGASVITMVLGSLLFVASIRLKIPWTSEGLRCIFLWKECTVPDCRKTLLALCFFVRIANGDVCRDLVIGGFISVYVCFLIKC